MKNTEIEPQPDHSCPGRRQFLTRSVAGGLAIALGGATLISGARAAETADAPQTADAPETPTEATPVKAYELVVKPSDHPELEKVGGFVTLETKVGPIVVARVSATEFSAVGAVCTHKGGPIEYKAEEKQFYCPWHKSKFDLKGDVIKGPAKKALPNYKGETAAVIKLD